MLSQDTWSLFCYLTTYQLKYPWLLGLCSWHTGLSFLALPTLRLTGPTSIITVHSLKLLKHVPCPGHGFTVNPVVIFMRLPHSLLRRHYRSICYFWWCQERTLTHVFVMLSMFHILIGSSYISTYICKNLQKKILACTSRHGSGETNMTSIHEDMGLIPGLANFVKDLAMLWVVV